MRLAFSRKVANRLGFKDSTVAQPDVSKTVRWASSFPTLARVDIPCWTANCISQKAGQMTRNAAEKPMCQKGDLCDEARTGATHAGANLGCRSSRRLALL